MSGNLVLRQVLQLPLRLADRSPEILGGGVRFADYFTAFTDCFFQPIEFTHKPPPSPRDWGIVSSLGSF